MCGIVGYCGKHQAIDVLLDGLRKLEYRGYDSAGVAIQFENNISLVRAKGKIINLETALPAKKLQGTTGISHTRWATHGAPNETNAHPHMSQCGRIAVVHNGIIENYSPLKKKLEREGIVFQSETDTEVIAQLMGTFYDGTNLQQAVFSTLELLEGAFGLAVISKEEPGLMIGARRGSPLVLGLAEEGIILASDVAPIVAHTDKVIYFDDNDVVVIRDDGHYQTYNLSQQHVTREVNQIEFDLDQIMKEGYDHFMLKEIFEQPEAIRNATRGRLLLDDGTSLLSGLKLNLQELRSLDRILIIGCGTSYYAAMVGEYMIESLAGIPVEVEYASEFRYRNPIIGPNTIVFCISQSGETADTLAALREAKRKGATVLGICNAVGSSIARETDGGVYLHAGPEIGVASTKAFTAQVTLLSMIALLLGRMRRLSHEEGVEISRAIADLPSQVEQMLAQHESIRTIAEEFKNATNFLYLGRHYNFPVAMEGALKLKEISYIHAEGYPAAEMKHGPIALIDKNMPVVVVANKDSLFEKVLSNVQEIRARGGRVIAITNADSAELREHCEHIITTPSTLPMLSPIINAVPLQLLAYYIAVSRGNDVDQPRNLAKSVTVE
jgi:glutamine---fructose-6-phosphate transaminase (isomerizing)